MQKKQDNNREWRDFSLKIIIIYEKIFKNNKSKLIANFATPNLTHDEQKRKKRTIENWIKKEWIGTTKEIKRPNKFNLEQFKISQYKMPNGTPLFPYDAFTSWSLEKFEKRVEEYLSFQQQNSTLEERIKFIYYYDIDNETLAFYEVRFPNIEKPYEINLYSRQLTNAMLYKGEMQEYQGMLYIFVKNNFDHSIYLFDNFATVFSQEVRIFGTGQSKDYFTRKPKAYMALLTSSILSQEEKQKYVHKLNRSNILIAKPFSRHNKMAKEYLVENFAQKIKMLNKDLTFCKEKNNHLYHELALQTFSAYERIAEKLSHNQDYFVHNKKSVKRLIYNSLALKKEEIGERSIPKVEILYALTPSNILLLELDNFNFSDTIQEQIQLVEEKRVELSYLFIVTEKRVINHQILQKLQRLAKHIPLKIVENSHPHYEEIIYPHNEPFILYQTFNDMGNYVHINKHSKERIDISREYQLLSHKAISLEEFTTQLYPLNGAWYIYSFGSNIDKQNHHTIELEIINNRIKSYFLSGVYEGVIQEFKAYTLLLLETTIVKIQNNHLNDEIFRISIIAKEQNIHNKDVLLFGLMSRKEIEKKEVCRLLDTIQKKESEHFRLKICDNFDTILGEFQRKNSFKTDKSNAQQV